jgi:hypothetical protein
MMFQAEIVEKIKIHILSSIILSENCAVYNNMGEKAKNTLLLFHCNNGYARASRCNVTHKCTLPILLFDDEVKEVAQKWLYETCENVINPYPANVEYRVSS